MWGSKGVCWGGRLSVQYKVADTLHWSQHLLNENCSFPIPHFSDDFPYVLGCGLEFQIFLTFFSGQIAFLIFIQVNEIAVSIHITPYVLQLLFLFPLWLVCSSCLEQLESTQCPQVSETFNTETLQRQVCEKMEVVCIVVFFFFKERSIFKKY